MLEFSDAPVSFFVNWLDDVLQFGHRQRRFLPDPTGDSSKVGSTAGGCFNVNGTAQLLVRQRRYLLADHVILRHAAIDRQRAKIDLRLTVERFHKLKESVR